MCLPSVTFEEISGLANSELLELLIHRFDIGLNLYSSRRRELASVLYKLLDRPGLNMTPEFLDFQKNAS
jgi:hypothetical protein